MATLVPWEPMRELSDLRSRLDQMVREVAFEGDYSKVPPIDIVREDGGLHLRCAIPGLEPDEVEIKFEDDQLTISGEHQEKKNFDSDRYLRKEFSKASYYRSITLPRDIDTDKITATVDAGMLEMELPLKNKPESGQIQITPKSGQKQKNKK